MKVLHVTAPADFGGLETVIRGLAEGQVAAGHEVHVAACLHSSGEPAFLESIRATEARIHTLRGAPRDYLGERRRLRDLIERIRPDVVHSHGLRPDAVCGSLRLDSAVRTVSTVHGYTGSGVRDRIRMWLHQRFLRRFDAVIGVSGLLVETLRQAGIAADRVHLVPNAWAGSAEFVDPDVARGQLGVPPDVFHLGWIGRLSHEKGPDLLLDALDRLGDLSLVASVVGEGPLLEELRNRTDGATGTGRVRWHGAVPDAARLFRAFDVVMLSSRTEGTPIVLLEAMAAGVPVICTRVGGVPDVVGEREAFVVDPLDPAALADAVRAVAEAPKEAEAKARAAEERLRLHYGRDRWIQRHDSIYSSS